MRVRIALGSLGLFAAATIAAACAGFSSEETPGVADAGSMLDTGAITDTSVPDSQGPTQDAGWGAPELLRHADAGAIVLRPSITQDGGDYYYSESTNVLKGSIYYASAIDAPGIAVHIWDGGLPIVGSNPSQTFNAGIPYLSFSQSGTIFVAVSQREEIVTPANVFPADGSPYFASDPYGTGKATYYVRDGEGFFRGEETISVEKRTGEPDFILADLSHPVVTIDETVLYFAAKSLGVTGKLQIWVASSGPTPRTFVGAHRLFANSTENEFPTWIGDDNRALIFTRFFPTGGSAAYVTRYLP